MNKRKKKNNFKRAIAMFCIVSFLWIFGFYIYVTYNNIEINTSNYTAEKVLSTNNEQNVDNMQEKSKKVADVLEETTQSVVGISKLKNTGLSILTNASESELGLGTGFFVTDNGYILSNEHVAGSKYSKCYVTTETGETYDGTVVWSDSDLDLAILKINIKNAKYVSLGNSKNLRVGESVYAIGNPIGFEFRRTVTSGIISAKNRTIKIDETTYMSDLIQTDATINPRE